MLHEDLRNKVCPSRFVAMVEVKFMESGLGSKLIIRRVVCTENFSSIVDIKHLNLVHWLLACSLSSGALKSISNDKKLGEDCLSAR